jgi:hypothetical protein
MGGKHESLPTHALILVSRSGFTPRATVAAEKRRIQLPTLAEVEAGEVAKALAPSSPLWGKITELSPTKVVAVVAPVGEIPGERVILATDTSIFSPAGRFVGMARDMTNALLDVRTTGELFGRDGREDHKYFQLHWEPVRIANGDRLFLQKINPPVYVPIEKVEVSGACKFSVCKFRMKKGSLGKVRISWGTGQLAGKSAMLVAIQGDGEEVRVTLDLRPPATLPQAIASAPTPADPPGNATPSP